MSERARLLVVGGGPVGLATAIEGRLAGLSVTVIEKRPSPIDKACGEGLMPGALAALQRWGVDPPGHPIAGIAYVDAAHRVEHRFRSGAAGRGVRRTVLCGCLMDRARGLGVEFVAGIVVGLDQDERGVTAEVSGVGEVSGDWLAGCDGLHSTVRVLAGLDDAVRSGQRDHLTKRFGVRRHFSIAPWTDLVEVHWGRHAELYVTPVDAGTVGVAVLGSRPLEFDVALAASPSLSERLAGAPRASVLLGAGPLRQSTLRRRAGRVMLVGDASGYVDALTGEGLRIGFAQARAVVDSIAGDDPGGYERAWSDASRGARAITSGLVRVAQSSARRAVVPAAARSPRAFGAVVERLAR